MSHDDDKVANEQADSGRRGFLKAASAAGLGMSAMAAYPAAIRKALAIAPATVTGTIKDVKHVVILMLENRSFDHYFGSMRGVRGFGDIYTVPQAGGRSIWDQLDATGKTCPPFRLARCSSNKALSISSTQHQLADAQAAWNDGRYGQWARYKDSAGSGTSMGYYTREELPFQYALADAFTVCDAYFSAVHGSTSPNRLVMFSGSNADPAEKAAGRNCTEQKSEPRNLRGEVQTPNDGQSYVYKNPAYAAFSWKTIPEFLHEGKISWRIYQDTRENFGGLMHPGLAFQNFRNASATPNTGDPGKDALLKALYDNGRTSNIDQLRAQVGLDQLPAVSWILPSAEQSDHPSRSNPWTGGNFVSRVLDALTSNPAVWASTALFITYDENDGFFDHVPPPAVPSVLGMKDGKPVYAGASTEPVDGEYFDGSVSAGDYYKPDASTQTLRPWGLGPRVPMIVVSPWSRGGWVNSQTFSHVSIGMFLEKCFGINLGNNISAWQRAVCGDLSSAFDFRGSDTSVTPAGIAYAGYEQDASVRVNLEGRAATEANPWVGQLSSSRPPQKEIGNKRTRPLPYQLMVTGFVWPANWVSTPYINTTFGNSGSAGAVFHVYDVTRLGDVPLRYTVGAGKSLAANLGKDTPRADGNYDFFVLGPAGFHRRLKGNWSATGYSSRVNPEVYFYQDTATRNLRLVLNNSGTQACTFTVQANRYPGADIPATNYTVNPNYSTTVLIPLKDTGGWYDITVTSVHAPGFERTAAGRLEDGQPGYSDPRQINTVTPSLICI